MNLQGMEDLKLFKVSSTVLEIQLKKALIKKRQFGIKDIAENMISLDCEGAHSSEYGTIYDYFESSYYSLPRVRFAR